MLLTGRSKACCSNRLLRVGIVMDLMSPETVQVVAIPAGSSHVLTLKSSVVLETN